MSTTTILVILVFLVVCASCALQFATYQALRSLIAGREEPQPAEPDEKYSPAIEDLDQPTEALKIVGNHPRPPFPAPMVNGETAKQWMIHLYNNDNIWAMFTDSFYVRLHSRPLVWRLFEGKDLNDIKRKFLATLLIMCDKGVNERAAATLVELHMHLNMSVKVYDSVMEALEETLVQYRVPQETISQFVPMIDYFRDEMTVA